MPITQGRSFRVREVEWDDGDSGKVTLDLGFGVIFRARFRLRGVNTPELRGPKRQAALVGHDLCEAVVHEGR